MKLKIVAVGKNKDKSIKQSIDEYLKQVKIDIIEVADGRNEADLVAEGNRILAKISTDEYVVCLAIDANQISSLEFSEKIEHILTNFGPKITFVIGGSHGLCQKVINRANFCLSLSNMTFPHLLARLILVEQIYRAIQISKNHPYHK